MDDVGARSLMAAILTRTYKDCKLPPKNMDNIRNTNRAKKWLRHPYCKDLCEAIDIDHKKYVEACLRDKNVKPTNKGAGSHD